MRVVVADDSALLREGLVSLLERRGHEVIAQVPTATELIAEIDALGEADALPDIVITDVRMPPGMTDDGVRAAEEIRSRWQVAVLLISQYVAPAYASALFSEESAAGIGYLLKDRVARVDDFMRSLELVAGGGMVIDPEVAARLMRGRRSVLDQLTDREREVLALMAEGLSNAQISEKLYLSAGAVAKHVAAVFAKLDLGPGEENRRVRAVLAFLTATTS